MDTKNILSTANASIGAEGKAMPAKKMLQPQVTSKKKFEKDFAQFFEKPQDSTKEAGFLRLPQKDTEDDSKGKDPLSAALTASQQQSQAAEAPQNTEQPQELSEDLQEEDVKPSAVFMQLPDEEEEIPMTSWAADLSPKQEKPEPMVLQSLVPQEAGEEQQMLAMLSGQPVKKEMPLGAQQAFQETMQSLSENVTEQPTDLLSAQAMQMAKEVKPQENQVLMPNVSEVQLQAAKEQPTDFLSAQAMQMAKAAEKPQEPVMQTPVVQEVIPEEVSPVQTLGKQEVILPEAMASEQETLAVKAEPAVVKAEPAAQPAVENKPQAESAVPVMQEGQKEETASDFMQQNPRNFSQQQEETAEENEIVQKAVREEDAPQLVKKSGIEKTEASHHTQAGTFQQNLQEATSAARIEQPANTQQPRDVYNIQRQIVEQARLLRTDESTEMIIRLKPAHLGDLTLKVSVSPSGAVNASFHSDNAQVRTILENSMVQLKQELSNQGLKVDKVEVALGFSDGQLPQEQNPQQAWQQTEQGTSYRNLKADLDSFEETSSELSASAQEEQSVAADGVDYLV